MGELGLIVSIFFPCPFCVSNISLPLAERVHLLNKSGVAGVSCSAGLAKSLAFLSSELSRAINSFFPRIRVSLVYMPTIPNGLFLVIKRHGS